MIAIATLLYLLAATPAAAECPLLPAKFGERIEQIVGHHNLDAIYDGGDGYTEIAARGSDVCKEFPEDVAVRFVFVKNIFVKLRIERIDSQNVLLAFAEAHFGAIEKKPSALVPGSGQFQHIWKPEEGTMTLYSAHLRNGKMMEYIELASLKHGALSGEAYDTQETDFNRLRER